MVADFADHAAVHDGLHAGLIRDVASDLHDSTAEVAALAADLEAGDATLDTARVGDLVRFADHLAACGAVLQDLGHRRRAS